MPTQAPSATSKPPL